MNAARLTRKRPEAQGYQTPMAGALTDESTTRRRGWRGAITSTPAPPSRIDRRFAQLQGRVDRRLAERKCEMHRPSAESRMWLERRPAEHPAALTRRMPGPLGGQLVPSGALIKRRNRS